MKYNQLFISTVAAAFALLTVMGSCSSDNQITDDQDETEATLSTYQARLVLKGYSDSTKVLSEMEGIENTFLTYLNAKSLKSVTFNEGNSEANDAAAVRQCELAAAVIDKAEYSASYAFFLIKPSTGDTLYSFRPTASNYRMEETGSDFDTDILPGSDDDYTTQTKYICDLAVAAAGSESQAQGELASRGYCIITQDLNSGVGGDYVYIGYKQTTTYSQAISNLYIIIGWHIGDFNYNGANYTAVSGFGNNQGSLNSNTGGKDMWLYYTKGGGALTSLEVKSYDSRQQSDNFVYGLNAQLTPWDGYRGIDINTGAGGSYRYIQKNY
ncbi:MAG: hypothetical protein ACI4V5_03540 [Prevotella sp.]